MVSCNPKPPSPSAAGTEAQVQVVPLVPAHCSAPAYDRRQAPRFTPLGVVRLLLTLEPEPTANASAAWFPADVLDISTGGLCVLIDHHLLPDSCIARGLGSGMPLKVDFQGHAVIESRQSPDLVEGHVRWIAPDNSGLWSLGLAFNTPLKQLPELHLG